MNKLYASLLLLVFFAVSISARASDLNSNSNSIPLKKDSYNPGVLVLNVKSKYRSICLADKIQNTKIQDAFSKISAYDVKKKFPRASVPERKTNKYGKKLVDLTLI